MAETKKKSKAKASKSKSRSSGKAKSKGAAKARSSSEKAAAKEKAPAKANGKEKAPAQANGGERAVAKAKDTAGLGPGANAALAGQAALAGSRAAGHAVGVVVSRARIPVVAGGGLVAGVAGGLALMRRRNGHHVAQATLDVDKVIAAARRAGAFGEELGRLASLLEQAGGGKRK
jgi:hypothetical protein